MGSGSSTAAPMSEIDFESYKGLRYTTAVPNTGDATHGPTYEVPNTVSVDEAQQTLYHNFLRGWSREGGSRPCYGRRVVDPATGKVGAFQWLTYAEVKTRMDDLASGLTRACGLKRQENVGIFAKNQIEWCLVAHACDRMAYVLVPLYDTLGPDAVPYIANHTEIRVLFCGMDQFHVVMDCRDACSKLQTVVQFEPITEEQRHLAAAKNIELKSLSDLELIGRAEPLPADPPLPTDISTLCYTSGTTGDPKGVILLHRNFTIISALAGERLRVVSTDVHLSYLPLPHVFERAVIGSILQNSAAAGFYQGDVLFLMEDLAELAPTLFVSVPRLFNRVYDKITQGVAAAGGLKKLMFDQAYASKRAGLSAGYKTHALWDALIFAKIRQVLGGRVRCILSGSAPLSADVKEFMKIVFCCDVVEGYGLSETSAGLCLASGDMPLGPHVGPPLVRMQVCLEDVPEMGYTSKDKPRPRGSCGVCWVLQAAGEDGRGDRRERLFHTGDIGCWNADGTLSIIDRKKNIFKLSQGEYVAAEKIEGVYLKSKYVAQIFVYGDSLQSCLVAVVVPDPETAEAWGHAKGLSGEHAAVAQLVHNTAFQKEVREDMGTTGKEAQLRGFELVKKVHFHPDPFSMEDGLITPTFKLKRPQLKARFQTRSSTCTRNSSS
ncbi:AMP-binding, conserved site [Phytophthora cactorum]|nr:AMP-binding, conserved site [Phytophthora cactorum]